MKGLARVNLLVGENNAGKTALLEAVQLLVSGGDPGVLWQAGRRRGEVAFDAGDERGEEERKELVEIAHVFHGHAWGDGSAIEIEADQGSVKCSVRDPAGIEEPPTLEIRSGASDTPRRIRLSRQGGMVSEMPVFRRGAPSPRPERQPVLFVGTESLDSRMLSLLWDEILRDALEGDVRDALRVIEPEVESVTMLPGAPFGLGSRAGVVVGIRGQRSRVPLGSLGEGMWRLLSVASALAFTRDGALFVDEIDTGLHYSVMADLWKLTLAQAQASNVQVFATTHSWDCIEGLSQVCRSNPELAARVALQKIDRGLSHSVDFDGEAIVRMVRGDIDPR